MFNTIRAELLNRLHRVSIFINEACDPVKNPNSAVTSKGIVFVLLYATYEYVVVHSVEACRDKIINHGLTFSDVGWSLLPLVLSDEFKSVSDAGPTKAWKVRRNLFNRVLSADLVPASGPFPSDGSHFRWPQLETIWALFNVGTPCLNNPTHKGRIEELVEHRNAIAHGRETPENIGGRYSVSELTLRLNDIRDICLHAMSCLETHCDVKANLQR
jgi:hypothetical protein